MTDRNPTRRARRITGASSHASLHPRPEEMWGRVLPEIVGAESPDDFEVRVKRAWEHMKHGFFTAEEHPRLYSCVAEILAHEEAAR